ncbi:Hypothetical predicted protein [Mytilus galloprovincialis]|uniref:Uncharacterized protein n=1 Tax=Mytilus galloprovincialis TaxID=29158 RepID=A0A8B6DVN2_MYTGA|nr:Hypothetical predicted protein [Mytilus galloprovincialis]
MSIFVESSMKNYMYPSARTSDIEELIGETLKHTPQNQAEHAIRQMYLSRLDYIDDDSDDELITSMEPVDVFVNSNEPTFVYTNQNQGPIVTFKNEQY